MSENVLDVQRAIKWIKTRFIHMDESLDEQIVVCQSYHSLISCRKVHVTCFSSSSLAVRKVIAASFTQLAATASLANQIKNKTIIKLPLHNFWIGFMHMKWCASHITYAIVMQFCDSFDLIANPPRVVAMYHCLTRRRNIYEAKKKKPRQQPATTKHLFFAILRRMKKH